MINPEVLIEFFFIPGAHLNPAVSLAMAVIGKFPLRKVLFYWLAQYLGALAAAASVLGVYSGIISFILVSDIFLWNRVNSWTEYRFSDAIQQYSNGTYVIDDTMNDPGLAGIFATYPAAWLSIQGGMGDQVIIPLIGRHNCWFVENVFSSFPSADIGYYAAALVHLCYYRQEKYSSSDFVGAHVRGILNPSHWYLLRSQLWLCPQSRPWSCAQVADSHGWLGNESFQVQCLYNILQWNNIVLILISIFLQL